MSPRRNGAIVAGGRQLYTAGSYRVLLETWLARIDCAGVVREHRVLPSRRWRADLAWPAHKVAVELQGAVYTRGHHVRGRGFEDDCEKQLAAAAAGWRVLPLTWGMIADRGQETAQLLNEVLGCTEPAHRRPGA